MPSPVAHISAGLFLSWRLRNKLRPLPVLFNHPALLPAALFAAFSVLPDMDTVAGLLAGDMGRYHNQQSHSLFVAFAVCVLSALPAAHAVKSISYRTWLGILFLPYSTHIIMDYFCYGRGVKMFWPVTSARYRAPLEIFYGFHWSRGWFHASHLYTLAEELAFASILALFTLLAVRISRRRSDRQQAKTGQTG